MAHILVVEDESHLAAGIRYNLEAEGHRVTVFGDGPAALRLLEEQADSVDLVILDIMLPGMSGYEICQAVRGAGYDVPVLILSARTLSEDRKRGFDVGADQYMMKPFDLDEFLSRVKNLLTAYQRRTARRTRQTPAVSEYAFGESRVNFETFEAYVGGKAVRLTAMEMRLLQYFAENEGRVIPRGELLENVWKMSPRAVTRAPDQFIRRLRKLFERDPTQPRHFRTIRDTGYRFLANGEGPEG